jgi:hypothetical protein
MARNKAAMTATPAEQQTFPIIELSANGRYHRKDLPPPPRSYKELKKHLLDKWFVEAMEVHMRSHREMKSFEKCHRSVAKKAHVLDCMWVFTYKFDKHGYLVKAKARLVVRGDQQARTTIENTYASTLAGKSFRTLMAIAARFDLELIQWDVVNAFVHADLPYDVFMKLPPGYSEENTILKLKKALYGLRESPLLWQRKFTATLRELGLEPVPHEPCCWTKDGVIIFFYVDDIVVAYRKENEAIAQSLTAALRARYSLLDHIAPSC